MRVGKNKGKWMINRLFLIHLGYSFNSILLFNHSTFIGGIPPPGRGIVGKSRSARRIELTVNNSCYWGLRLTLC